MVNFFRRGLKKSNNATGSAPASSSTAGNATQSNGRKPNAPAATPKRNNGRKPNAPAATPKRNNGRRTNAPKRNNRNVTVMGSGTRVRNYTNTIKSLGTRAVALGGAAYKMYLVTPTADLMKIAAVCYIIIYMASAFLGQGTSPQIRLLQANIKNAERALVQRRKNDESIFRAFMSKGNINKAANYKRQMNEKYAPNYEKIGDMKNQLLDIRREIAKVAPPSFSQVVQNTINTLTPAATTLLALQGQIAQTQLQVTMAETAQQKARREADQEHMSEARKQQEYKIQEKIQTFVAPLVSGVKAVAGGVKNLASVSGNLQTAKQYVVSGGTAAAAALGRYRAHRTGQA